MSDPKFKNIGTPETRLIEELSELIQIVCKAQRFGWDSYHPNDPSLNNLELARKEWGDVTEAWDGLMVEFLKRSTGRGIKPI